MTRKLTFAAVTVAFSLLTSFGFAEEPPALGTTHTMLAPKEVMFGEGPPSLPPGAKMAVLYGDPAKTGLFIVRAKFPANYKIPPHLHKASENVTVLAGTFYMGLGEKFDQGSGQELPVGGFASIPANHPHYAWAGKEETVVQVHGVGPSDLRFVNPADDPRQKK